ncbi:hypothetical protein [Massilia sp. TWR1-2-2]|uniref:hypothetical protein n=1 Tax=Massilia sp. TWR1-2-2 TaxID=2804584 RepID=UPI003CF70FE2
MFASAETADIDVVDKNKRHPREGGDGAGLGGVDEPGGGLFGARAMSCQASD